MGPNQAERTSELGCAKMGTGGVVVVIVGCPSETSAAEVAFELVL